MNNYAIYVTTATSLDIANHALKSINVMSAIQILLVLIMVILSVITAKIIGLKAHKLTFANVITSLMQMMEINAKSVENCLKVVLNVNTQQNHILSIKKLVG